MWGGNDIPDIAKVNYIQDKIEEAGYPFLNCAGIQDEFSMDYKKDYWGDSHFNIYGAEKITAVVGEYLRTTYDLPDRRDDPDYAQWNDDLYLYHKNVKDAKASLDKAMKKANIT